jgi:uncharacterized protein (DUF58 family)
VPTVWFAALVALSAVALFAWPGRSWNAFLIAEGVVAVFFLLDAIACTSPSKIGVSREAPDTLRVGDEGQIAWVIENRAARRTTAVVTDALWPSLRASRRSVRVELEPGTRVRLRADVVPSRRGRFPLDDVTVRTVGPMRMVVRQATRDVPGVIRVMPAYPSRDEVRRRMRVPRVPNTGIRSIRIAGAGTEFDQLREYMPDDESRRIDWSSTIRLQRPIVKQYRTERNQTVVVLLDNGRLMTATVGEVPRVEHAMDAVLGLAETCVHVGDRVGLVCFDRQVRSVVPPSSGRSQLGRLAEAMYLLEPDLAESAYTAAFSLAASRFRRRSLYVILTDLAESSVEQALVPALTILVRTHLVVVASVQDPVIADWAHGTGERRWASEAFRSAAAVATLQQRELAAARLRTAGAVVLDAEPGRLAVDLVDTYMALKAAGRL